MPSQQREGCCHSPTHFFYRLFNCQNTQSQRGVGCREVSDPITGRVVAQTYWGSDTDPCHAWLPWSVSTWKSIRRIKETGGGMRRRMKQSIRMRTPCHATLGYYLFQLSISARISRSKYSSV
ncbi:hypothetical protein J6590_035925 [Homalodisca vitripennis]|nr:hypothetical protein J6590_035925 [Homalodisca vitripennis]